MGVHGGGRPWWGTIGLGEHDRLHGFGGDHDGGPWGWETMIGSMAVGPHDGHHGAESWGHGGHHGVGRAWWASRGWNTMMSVHGDGRAWWTPWGRELGL